MATVVDGEDVGQATPDGQVAPATRDQRLGSLDLIRGFAVLGILAANIVAFGQPFTAYMWPEAFLSGHDATADWLWVAQLVAVDGKMRGLFTLLFGAGMMLFMDKAWARGATRDLQARRLGILFLFGAIHFYLIWRGDILMLYAAAGIVMLAFLRWQTRSLLVVGLVAYVLGGLFYGLAMGMPHFIADTSMGQMPELAAAQEQLAAAQTEATADDAAEIPILTDGNWFGFVAHNFSAHLTDPLSNIMTLLFETLPLMLVGAGLYRGGLFSGEIARGKQLGWGWAGIIVGTALTIPIALYIKNGGLTYWGTLAALTGFTQIPRLFVILGLAAVLAVWGMNTQQGWLAERLSAAGRVAFTNYLGTSVLMMLIFHPWAGGLWGELTRPELYLVVALGWAVMLGWSKPWLEKYRYGPLEWLWRCLTYGKRFPLRR